MIVSVRGKGTKEQRHMGEQSTTQTRKGRSSIVVERTVVEAGVQRLRAMDNWAAEVENVHRRTCTHPLPDNDTYIS